MTAKGAAILTFGLVSLISSHEYDAKTPEGRSQILGALREITGFEMAFTAGGYTYSACVMKMLAKQLQSMLPKPSEATAAQGPQIAVDNTPAAAQTFTSMQAQDWLMRVRSLGQGFINGGRATASVIEAELDRLGEQINRLGPNETEGRRLLAIAETYLAAMKVAEAREEQRHTTGD